MAVDAYVVYWDEGHLASGNFTELARIPAYDQNWYNVTVANTAGKLATGGTYRFTVSAINKVGEGLPSAEITARAKSLPAKPGIPLRVTSVKHDSSTANVTLKWY